MNYWRYYLPAVFLIGLGLFFFWFQALAVAIVVVGFIGLGTLYAIVVSQLIQRHHERNQNNPNTQHVHEASFRDVTVYVAEKVKLVRSQK